MIVEGRVEVVMMKMGMICLMKNMIVKFPRLLMNLGGRSFLMVLMRGWVGILLGWLQAMVLMKGSLVFVVEGGIH